MYVKKNIWHLGLVLVGIISLLIFGIGNYSLTEIFSLVEQPKKSTLLHTNNNKDMNLPNQIPYTYKVHPDTFVLAEAELATIFDLIAQARIQFNAQVPAGSRGPALPLDQYIYSIAPVRNGESGILHVNGFPLTDVVNPNWYLIEVDDGGNSYIDIEVNVPKKTVLYFSTHGES